MRDRWRQADGFATASGLAAVATGPLLLVHGAPAGWSFLLIAAGIVLLATQWIVVSDLQFEALDGAACIGAAAAMACAGVAVVYLTRAADDLPSLFPGHDGDSEHFRILPGIVMLTLAAVLFTRAVIASRPARHAD